MEEKDKGEQAPIPNRITEEDRKYFAFYKLEVQAISGKLHRLILREQVACRCPAHFIQFNFFYN